VRQRADTKRNEKDKDKPKELKITEKKFLKHNKGQERVELKLLATGVSYIMLVIHFFSKLAI